MSKALLKQSLAIVEEGMSDKKEPKEKELPTSRTNKRNQQLPSRPLKKPVKKITIEDIRNESASKSKRVEENIQKLLTLSKPSARIRNSKNIIKRAHTGRYIIEKKKVKVEQESLFTEEDFAAFEKELAKTIT